MASNYQTTEENRRAKYRVDKSIYTPDKGRADKQKEEKQSKEKRKEEKNIEEKLQRKEEET